MEILMTIREIKALFFSILALVTMPMLAVCLEMEIWSDGTHYRYLIKDWHVDYIDGRISIQQQADIIWAAQQNKGEGVFVIAEDMLGYSGTNKKIHHFNNQDR